MNMNRVVVVILALIGIGIVGCDAGPRVEQQLLDALSPVCEGQGVEQAAAYAEGPEPHPIVLLDSSGNRHSWTDKLPIQWWPTPLNPPELVACVAQQEKVKIQTCKYRGDAPDVTRYRYEMEVSVAEARTGETLDHTVLSGSSPPGCRDRERWSLTELKGSDVSFEDVQAWLEPHIMRPAPEVIPFGETGTEPSGGDGSPAADTATPQADGTGTPQADGTGTPTASSAGVAPSDFLDTFHFTSDISVAANGGIVLNVEGDYQAPDRIACTISGGIGGVTFAKDELIVIGGDAWIDTGSGWTSTTASDPEVQTDLALCPGSADYWSDFDFVEDLSGLVGGDRETVNGVPAIRYDVGDAFQGLASLGLLPPDLEGVEIELFAVWLAEDERWPVAMEMIASGDAEAWADAMIIPPDDAGSGEATLQMRIDISQVNSSSIRVSRPAGQ